MPSHTSSHTPYLGHVTATERDGADGDDVQCPFCNECGFDLIGLKQHLKYYCDDYALTPDLPPPLNA